MKKAILFVGFVVLVFLVACTGENTAGEAFNKAKAKRLLDKQNLNETNKSVIKAFLNRSNGSMSMSDNGSNLTNVVAAPFNGSNGSMSMSDNGSNLTNVEEAQYNNSNSS